MHVRQNIKLYKKNCDVHSINTRGKHKLCVPYCRLRKVHNSFVGLGIRFYNKIPRDILALPYDSFKTKIKSQLILKAYYSIEDYFNDKESW